MPRILLINHYKLPDPAPTGRLLCELGEMLEDHAWEVQIIDGAKGNYGNKKSGKLDYLLAHGRIFLRSLFSKKADVILSLTDPPCLLLTSWFLSKIKRAKLAHWVMDLYPELAHSLGELSSSSLNTKIKSLMDFGIQNTDLLVVLDSDMRDRISSKAKIIPPWVEDDTLVKDSQGYTPREISSSFKWLYSGNLGRAHDWKTMLDAQKILENKNVDSHLIIQGRGAMIEDAKSYQKNKGINNIIFRDYAPKEKLVQYILEVDASVVSLLPELKGMLWPSKLALLQYINRPIFWIGDSQSAPASLVNSHGGGSKAFDVGDSEKLASHIFTLMNENIDCHYLEDVHLKKSESGDQFHEWLTALL